jgi:hypothetical protein
MSATTTTTTTAEETQTQRRSSADVLQQYGNDAIRMADRVAELERDNYRYREQKRDLTDRVKALEGKQIPEGAVVLTGDEAQAYDAYKGLGTPADLTKRLGDADAATTRLAELEREGKLREVADAAGYKLSVLKQIGGDREYELRDVTADGQTTKVAFVKDGDTAKPLAEFATTAWADFLPSLTATGGNNGSGQQGTGQQTIPRQQGSQAARPTSSLDDFITRRNEQAASRPNPLAPKTA